MHRAAAHAILSASPHGPEAAATGINWTIGVFVVAGLLVALAWIVWATARNRR